MLKEFKKFALSGNALELAVGIIIGASFGRIVSSLVNDILTPPLGLIIGKVDFSNLFLSLDGKVYKSLSEAKAAGAATINYGLFMNCLIDFLIVAIALFIIIRQMNIFKNKYASEAAETKKECPYCLTKIPAKAVKCPACASSLEG
jgi:large conductance mechanosensitive channel